MRWRSLAGWLALVSNASALADAAFLRIYTTWPPEQTEAYEKAYLAENSTIRIQWLRDTATAIQARLQAEKASPQADLVFGVPATALLAGDTYALLQPYAPKAVDKLAPTYVDTATPPRWMAINAWSATLCFNPLQAAKHGLAKPASWQDLLAPAYKGLLVMPDPARSDTGYLYLSSWIALWGEPGAWAFMDKLHDNIAYYSANGSQPCRLAAAGEMVVGLSFDFRAARLKIAGAPLELVFPQEGLGWDFELAAQVAGSTQSAAGRQWLDWAATRPARELAARQYAMPLVTGDVPLAPQLPADLQQRWVKQDISAAATHRQRIVAEWSRRYGSKVEAVKVEAVKVVGGESKPE